MAWKGYADYLSKYGDQIKNTKSQIDSLYSQINNFDNTYDHTKDAGWIAANNQIQSDAKIAANNAYGRLSNRIGATSTAQQVASDSVYANALKNSQNLIPTYKDAALNKLKNQYSLLENNLNNILALDQQDYNRWYDKRNFDYQMYVNDENNRIAEANAKAAQIKAESEAKAKAQKEASKIKNGVINAYGNGGVNGRKELYNYLLTLDTDYPEYVESALESIGLGANWFNTAAGLREKTGFKQRKAVIDEY